MADLIRRWCGLLAAPVFVVAVGCGESAEPDLAEPQRSPHALPSSVEADAAVKTMRDLLARHAALSEVRLKASRNLPEMEPLAAASDDSLLASAAGLRFEAAEPGGLDALLPEPAARNTSWSTAVRARVRLPAQASGAVELEDARLQGEVAITFALSGAGSATAELADGLVVYRGALGGGTSVVQRVTEDGTEDYVWLGARPDREELEYTVDVRRVAGLRLVANTLEFLDAGGAPRLRVAPPYVIGADGERREARITVDGCAADESPAAPWGRAVTAPGASWCALWVRWEGVDYPAVVDPAWKATGSMAVARLHHTASLLGSGRVLIAGGSGCSGCGAGFSSAELYDPATGTFSTTGSMTAGRWNHTASLLSTGKVLIAGGGAGSQSLSSAEVYDPGTGVFTVTGSMATARTYHTASVIGSGKVLIAGGMVDFNSWTATAQLYDPATGTFSATGLMATARAGHTASVLGSGKVLVAGGYSGGPSLSSTELYDPTTGTFAPTGAMTATHSQHTASVLGSGRVLVAGGSGSDRLSAELYDPTTGTFSTTGAMASSAATASVLGTGKVLLTGGSPSNTQLYDPATGTFSATGSMMVGRHDHTASVLGSGKVLVAGGMPGSSGYALSSAELYILDGLGGTCTFANECQSGNCRNGACCPASCTGTCESCKNSDTGGPNGQCLPVLNGTDPASECGTGGTGLCALPGVCDGTGKCKTQQGTECLAGSCASETTQQNPSQCDATGFCASAGSTNCAPYKCSGTACATSCSTNSDCQSPSQCIGGHCGSGIANGNSCSSSDQCQSLHCVEGVCCNTACSGACTSCLAQNKASGLDGQCGPVLSGTDPKNGCDASSPPCGPDGVCDGQGLCRAFAPATAACGATLCAGGSVSGKLCDGSGICTDTSGIKCDEYKCNPQGTACLSSCSVSDDCAVGYFCKNAACTPALDAGQACTQPDQCLSGFCKDGYCCDGACDGRCESCSGSLNQKGKDGECGLVVAGSVDPNGTCSKDTTNPCGTDAKCDDEGQCRLTPKGAECGAASCDQESQVTQACDGYGKCQESVLPCAPNACDPAAGTCNKGCETNADCATGAECNPTTGQCASTNNKCKDDFTVVSPGGTETPCGAYRCSAGVCRDSCSTGNDCAPGYACSGGECRTDADGGSGADTSIEQDKGCGCRTPGNSGSGGGPGALAGLALLIGATRRRRSKAQRRLKRQPSSMERSQSKTQPPKMERSR